MSGDVQATPPPPRPSVFLSYASEDRAAARVLRDTLVAAGLEVWLDEDELGGGEAWDAKIRNQIRTCTYFMPLISATTEVRREGYFRREWRLAVERTLDFADDVLFLVPVVIDDTRDAGARVPEKFFTVQWLRVPGGRVTPELTELAQKLATGGTHAAPVTPLAPPTPGKARKFWRSSEPPPPFPKFPAFPEPGHRARFIYDLVLWFGHLIHSLWCHLPRFVRIIAAMVIIFNLIAWVFREREPAPGPNKAKQAETLRDVAKALEAVGRTGVAKDQDLSKTIATLVDAATEAMQPARTPPTPLPVPAAPGAMGSSLTQGPDGTAFLSWLEPAGGETWALKFSRFDAAAQRWGDAHLIAQGADFFVNWADFPVLAVQPGRLTAVWFVNNPAHHAATADHHGAGYRAVYSSSRDDGATWSPALPVSDESLPVEFVALQPLRDGRLLAAWLDGRAQATGNARQALYSRVLGAPGPDTLVDDSVCDCCQLSFVPTTDGGALLAYRGRTKDEMRDMRLARFDGRTWSPPGPLNADGWKIAGCPVNGPQLAQNGGQIGAVWFTAADNQARVLARVSDDAGESFGPVTRVDLGRPQGRVDNVMQPDGTLVMTWLESAGKESGQAGGIYLRTLSPEGKLSAPQMLVPASTSRMSGFPRTLLLGERQLLLTCTQDGEPTQLRTFRVDLK
jgi:hypothetical protein